MDDDLERRLREIENRIDMVQGDVNMIATIDKERDRDLIEELVNRNFGQSDNKRLCWYYANGERTTSELSEITGIRESNIRAHLADLNNEGLLIKSEDEDNIYYQKSKLTTGVGIESDIEEFVDEL